MAVTRKQLILITGKIGVGKTTVTNMLVNTHNYHEESFATPLKNFALSLGFNYNEVYGTQKQKLEKNKFYNISGREFLQRFGTDVIREIPDKIPNMNFNNYSLLTRALECKIVNNTNSKIVVSDGRFEDEINLIKKYNGIIIKVVRDKNEHSAPDHINSHISESLDIKEDFIIDNNGCYAELEQNVHNLIKIIEGQLW